uniref:ribosomal protein S11 n=1 Tax=Tetraselmis marina TaxID=41888 RepID=UPI0021822F50|nr:ribosomal protein S11 [Tetraselmis marina]UVF37916.1 ribosomal protein S11 [Tetraselmis marina]
MFTGKIQKKRVKYKSLPKLKPQKPSGVVYIQSTNNNTIVTLTDLRGNTKYWASGGSCGFKKSRRSSTYAAQVVAETVAKEAFTLGLRIVKVKMKGTRYGKQHAVKGLSFSGLKIISIEDVTSIAHNGCRLPKQRRT